MFEDSAPRNLFVVLRGAGVHGFSNSAACGRAKLPDLHVRLAFNHEARNPLKTRHKAGVLNATVKGRD